MGALHAIWNLLSADACLTHHAQARMPPKYRRLNPFFDIFMHVQVSTLRHPVWVVTETQLVTHECVKGSLKDLR